MSDIKISAFPQASTLNGAEMIPATQGTTPSKILISQISTKVQGDIAVQTFSAASLTNPYTSSISPHRIGDIALNLTSLEIWQATSTTASASSWNRISGGYYGGSVITDLNTPVSSGYYTALGTAANVPDSAYSWFINHVNSNTGTISAYQRAVAYSTTIIVYERTKINSVWGAWTSFAQQVQENVLSCGVQFNFDSPATALTRIGNNNIKDEIFSTCIRPVTLNDSGVVTQELATNINYKTNGQASDLTGASGQCMVGIKKFYIKRTTDAQNRLTKLQFSLVPLPGFTLHEKFTWGNGRDEIFVGMFEASTSGTLMQSIVGGSIYVNVTLATARAQAVARGTGWHTYDFYTQDVIQSLWYLYFAELNSQISLPGYTELSAYADSYRRTTGRTNTLSSINGSIKADATIDSDIYSLTWKDTNKYIANRFFWIENMFGHVWKTLDGCSPDGRVAGLKHMFATPNPNLFSSDQATILSTYTDLGIPLASSSNESYMSSIGAYGNPITLGGSSSTYVTDYDYNYLADNTKDYCRLLLAGGIFNTSAPAGVAARLSYLDLASALSGDGFRLCFEKN
jgi:hypothetical protein